MNRGMAMLHLTNGDNTAEMIAIAGVAGECFAWRDILHDGPVPPDLDTASLAKVRAKYIAAMGWGEIKKVSEDFHIRDQRLTDLSGVDELVLWFEHDLYDQLQILQIMDRLFQLPYDKRPGQWSIICISSFPGISKFEGLGQLQPSDLLTLLPQRAAITQEQLQLGQRGWAAFRAPTPNPLKNLLKENLADLPFLAAALQRHFQQFPSICNGLNHSEHLTLSGLVAGIVQAGALFRYQNHQEQHPYLGDWSYWQILKKLSSAEFPAIRIQPSQTHPPTWKAKVSLTPFGEALLAKEADFVEANGVDQWHGGVYLCGKKVPWRWHRSTQDIVTVN